MPKISVLDIVQRTLNDLGGDDVNTINDTLESTQVANIVRDEYESILTERIWPNERGWFQLIGLSDTNRPNYLILPEHIEEMNVVKYNVKNPGETRDRFMEIGYLEPVRFMEILDGRNNDDSNVIQVIDFDNTVLHIIDDRDPTWWTSFDDVYVIFDSYDSAIDTTVQTSKNKTWAVKNIRTAFSLTDDYIPDLPEDQFPLLLATVKARAAEIVRQAIDAGAQRTETRFRRKAFRKGWRTRGGIKTPDYGRSARVPSAGVNNRNPLFDKN